MPAKDIYHDTVKRALIKDGWTIMALVLMLFVGLLSFACQNQTISNSTNQTNSTNSNASTQPTSQITAPQTVKFTSAEKVEIVGTFYESPKANSPAVLLLHQWGSDRHSYEMLAKRLQAKGFGVLAIDGRGFGDSNKATDGKTVAPARTDEAVKAMKADVDNAFQFLAKQKNVDANRVGIVGASYGSSLAIIYSAENPKVKAVALLSPGLNYFGNMPTESAVKNYSDRPLLLVAAEDDKESAETVKKLKEVDAKSETQIYEKGGHGTGLFAAKVGLEDLLEQFLMKSL
ncbi:MAG: alpha/beta fold hydrolase [Pyrinomonadaceae bacterium]|nr:alpha/beta fold hydrolase [Pyrinomonadaceae bacterium]